MYDVSNIFPIVTKLYPKRREMSNANITLTVGCTMEFLSFSTFFDVKEIMSTHRKKKATDAHTNPDTKEIC